MPLIVAALGVKFVLLLGLCLLGVVSAFVSRVEGKSVWVPLAVFVCVIFLYVLAKC